MERCVQASYHRMPSHIHHEIQSLLIRLTYDGDPDTAGFNKGYLLHLMGLVSAGQQQILVLKLF